MRMHHFGVQNGPFAPNKFFLENIINIIFSLCKVLKKFSQCIQSYDDAPFLGPKWPICPNEDFFSENMLINIAPFIHAYLHAKNQSLILIF